MNICTKVVNNFRYAYHRKMADIYLERSIRNVQDGPAFKRYVKRWIRHMHKCVVTPI